MEEVRLIKKSELNQALAFNAREYGAGQILSNRVYYDWQFNNHLNTGGDYTSWGIFSKIDGQLLGVFGYFEADYNFFGKAVTANCLCNLIVKQELRSLGFGYLLLERAASYNDLAVDYAIKKDIWPMFEKSGWRSDDLKRFFYVIDPVKTQELIGHGARVMVSPRPQVGSDPGWSFEEIKEAESSIDELWAEVKQNYPITIERTHNYLNWRYLRHPLLDYHVFAAKEQGRIKSLAVLRLESPLTYRLAHIVDLVAAEGWAEYTLAKLIEYCLKNKVDWIDYFFSGLFHLSELQRLGFFDGAEEPYNRMPLLFNPIDRTKRTKINFAVKLINKSLSNRGDWQDLPNWYTTKGGGDQDRPN